MIRGLNGEDGWLDQHPTNTNSSQFVELPEGDSNYQYSSQSIAGNALRDQIAMQMWNDYNNHQYNFDVIVIGYCILCSHGQSFVEYEL